MPTYMCDGIEFQTKEEADAHFQANRDRILAQQAAQVPDVKEIFRQAKKTAEETILGLKSGIWLAMVGADLFPPADATVQGVKFVDMHQSKIDYFEQSGGHPEAAKELKAAIYSVPSALAFPWVNNSAVKAVINGHLPV